MTPEETFGQLLGLGKSWRVVEARLDPKGSMFVLKVEETPERFGDPRCGIVT